MAKIRASYDAVAPEYAEHISDELNYKPFERKLLAESAASCGSLGPICDLGCGPGHVAHYLKGLGVDALGLDLSYGALEQARRRFAGISFVQANMLALPFGENRFGGIACLYSIIHLAETQIGAAFAEMHQVLRTGGGLLVGFHVGSQVEHKDEVWGVAVDLDAFFLRTDWVAQQLSKCGFQIERTHERDPYPEVEYQSRRGYIVAVKPEGKSAERRR